MTVDGKHPGVANRGQCHTPLLTPTPGGDNTIAHLPLHGFKIHPFLRNSPLQHELTKPTTCHHDETNGSTIGARELIKVNPRQQERQNNYRANDAGFKRVSVEVSANLLAGL